MKLAERQYGLVTRDQARNELSDSAIDRRLASGRWAVVLPGVYRVVGAPRSEHQHALAVALWAGGPISHLSAARLLRLDGCPHPGGLDVTVNRRTGLSAPDVVVHRATLPRLDRVTVDGIPCTSATRTLVDCAPLLEGEQLEVAFEHARRMGLTSVDAVAARLGRGRAGSAMLRGVLAHAQSRPAESRLEVKTGRLIRGSTLPAPVSQYRIGRFRVDFAWPFFRVVCECDGFTWHGSRLQWKHDRRRIAEIEAEDWHVVHVTWDDVTNHPHETLDRLAVALRRAA
jgi:very-short-patch-repair endonuclease